MRSLKDEKMDLSDNKRKFNTTCSCDNPIDCLRHMFCTMVQERRVVEEGQCPARRPVFLRTHGIIKGEVVINDDIPEDYKHGLFAQSGRHPVYLRYSSDLADGRPDWESTIGLGIKIFNVTGDKVVTDDGADVADLLLQNVPNFFVDTARDMCNFTKAGFEGWSDEWVQDNAPNTNNILDDMAKPIRSVFGTSLWSVVPFKLGDNGYCKYIVKPGVSTFAQEVDIDDPNFLGKDLSARMLAGKATLDIYIQRRPDATLLGETYLEEHFPLDRATVVWDEKMAPPIKVAQVILEKQNIDQDEQTTYGDWLSFNIGRVPVANEPVGSIAEARMSVYQTSAEYRQKMNGQPSEEPSEAGKPEIENPSCPFPNQAPKEEMPESLTHEQIARITHVKVHPGIGVARVGNSQKEYYIGPEVTNPHPTEFGSTRDIDGAIKRQAARFRIYGYDANGDVVAEVQQADNSHIEWSVHVANKKAQWYEFDAAMDIPATAELTVPLRNPKVTGSGRNALCIDPGETKIMGVDMNDSSYVMSGNFQGTPVTLGELRTDEVGRLLVLGGFGKAESPTNKPVFDPAIPSSFNNAAGWFDDTSDGPVHAKVTIGNKDFIADPAWVCVTPPNYAPDTIGWRNMDDLMRGVFISSGMMEVPKRVSFKQDVLPILQRLSGLQWVNKGFLAMFGADAPMNFNDKALIKKLGTAPISQLYPDPYMELRRTIYNSFRPTNTRTVEEGAWPWMYGDAFGYTDPDPLQPPSPRKFLRLPPLYDHVLSTWVSGDFISDHQQTDSPYQNFNDINLQQQPESLDRAAMHFCLADAFHPGAELTWPMRHASMYRAPYRLRQRAVGKNDPSYGASLSQGDVLAIAGPLYEQSPGDLTRWMAVPWQGDTAYCRSGYDMEYDPYLPTFWPARVPNQVLSERNYEILSDKKLPMSVRIAAFQNRESWLRQLPAQDPAPQQMQYMIDNFSEMGIIESKKKPDDIDWLPDLLYVESLTAIKQAELSAAYKEFEKTYAKLSPTDKALYEAGWFSDEQRNEFATVKRRGH